MKTSYAKSAAPRHPRRKPKRPASARPGAVPGVSFEQLESRLLLSTLDLTSGGSGALNDGCSTSATLAVGWGGC